MGPWAPIVAISSRDNQTRLRRGAAIPLVNWEAVTPHYFQAMRIRLLQGRNFDDRDNEQAARVVIVSEALATHVWPGENPSASGSARMRLKKA